MIKYSLIAHVIVLLSFQADAQSAINSIPVVTTWEQLRDAPIVATGDFGIVRVGIESATAPKFGGTLVYALVQRSPGDKIPTRFSHDNVLGPLHCRIYRKPAPIQERSKMIIEVVDDHASASELVYTRAVFIDTVGDYHVEVSLDGKHILSSATIKGTDDSFHAWTPLTRSNQPTPPIRSRGDRVFFAGLSARPRGPALPTHEGIVSVAMTVENQERQRNEPLPKLIPPRQSRTLELSGDHRELMIESETEMIVARPDWHYLARWWVNGKPFKLSPFEHLADQNGLITSGRRVRVLLDFDPADFDAKPGDKMGLQLLHLPNGWRSVDSLGIEHLSAGHEGPTVSRMTNRIEFTAP